MRLKTPLDVMSLSSPLAVTNIDLCFKLSALAGLHRRVLVLVLEHIKYLL